MDGGHIKIFDKNTNTYFNNRSKFGIELWLGDDKEFYYRISSELPDGSIHHLDIQAMKMVDIMLKLIKKKRIGGDD